MRALLWFLAAMGFASPALAFQDCTTAEFADEYLEDATFQCEAITQTSLDAFGRQVQLRSLRNKGDERSLQYEPIVMDAAATTLNWLTPYAEAHGLKIKDVTFVFPDTSSNDKVHKYGDSNDVLTAQECVIRLYVNSFDTVAEKPLDKLPNTVAHEMFHCVQRATWQKQMGVGADRIWWSEATAQFIGHWIFEEPSELAVKGDAFGKATRSLPLYKGSAFGEEVVLMAWIARGNRVDRIFDFIKAMPTAAGADAQRDALVKVAGQSLPDFARAFLNGEVAMPSGTAFAPPAQTLASEVNNSRVLDLKVTPFTIFAFDVEFAGGNYYSTTSGTPDLDYKEMFTPKADWQVPMMLNISQDCNSSQTLRFGGMAVGTGGDETYTLNITKEAGCEACAVTEERNSCLNGTWVADAGDLAAMVQSMQPDQLTGAKVSGVFAVKFDNTGKAIFGFSKFRLIGKPVIKGAPKFSVDIAGTIDNSWSSGGKHLQMCYISSKAALQIGIPGAMGDPIMFADLPMQKSQQYDFDCSADGQSLTLQGDLSGTKFNMRFSRADKP
ncbi:MAG: hypothetical protein ACOH2M_09625 [Cypionkella sp.]